MNLQQKEVSQLTQAIALYENGRATEADLTQLIGQIMEHYHNFVEQRNLIAQSDVSSYFAPAWCTSLENSVLWIGGCRPSAYLHLINTIYGLKIEAQLPDFLTGKPTGDLGELTWHQIHKIYELQREIIKKETHLSTCHAELQHNFMAAPLAAIPLEQRGDAEEAVKAHTQVMVGILRMADKLRQETVMELIKILSPPQAVKFLLEGKKLQLCMREWGRKMDGKHGRKSETDH